MVLSYKFAIILIKFEFPPTKHLITIFGFIIENYMLLYSGIQIYFYIILFVKIYGVSWCAIKSYNLFV